MDMGLNLGGGGGPVRSEASRSEIRSRSGDAIGVLESIGYLILTDRWISQDESEMRSSGTAYAKALFIDGGETRCGQD